MSEAQDELRGFIAAFTGAYDLATLGTEPGDDAQPMLGIRAGDEESGIGVLALAPIPGFALQDSKKDKLFGHAIPMTLAQARAEMGAFCSFAWQTVLAKAEREAISKAMKKRGHDPADTAAVREVAENLGIHISDPMRRLEVCTLCAVSANAEAMMCAHVKRGEDHAPQVEWAFSEPTEDDHDGIGLVVTDRPGSKHKLAGRVIEGLRAGIDRTMPGVGDWRGL